MPSKLDVCCAAPPHVAGSVLGDHIRSLVIDQSELPLLPQYSHHTGLRASEWWWAKSVAQTPLIHKLVNTHHLIHTGFSSLKRKSHSLKYGSTNIFLSGQIMILRRLIPAILNWCTFVVNVDAQTEVHRNFNTKPLLQCLFRLLVSLLLLTFNQ